MQNSKGISIMATEQSFIDYLIEQLHYAQNIATKKMFGEYALYCNEKVVAFICDNQFFLKPTKAGEVLLKKVTLAPPYHGAKGYFLLDQEIENPQFLSQLVEATAGELPAPKPKSKSKPNAKTAR
jgi:TfoX/Sxy family transcriptional regulator of competence genes